MSHLRWATAGGMKIPYIHLFSLQPLSVHFFLSLDNCIRVLYAFVIYMKKKKPFYLFHS